MAKPCHTAGVLRMYVTVSFRDKEAHLSVCCIFIDMPCSCVYIYIYIYIYTHTVNMLPVLCIYISIYTGCTYVCRCVYIYIHTNTHTQASPQRESDTSRFPTTAANSMQFATNSVLHILRCLIQSLPLIQCLVTILLQPRIGKIQPASFYRGGLPPSSRCCTVFSFLVASNRWGEIHPH